MEKKVVRAQGTISVTSKNDSSVKDSTAINKTIPAIGESHTHRFVEWRYDAKEHWRVCSCGEKSVKSKHFIWLAIIASVVIVGIIALRKKKS